MNMRIDMRNNVLIYLKISIKDKHIFDYAERRKFLKNVYKYA